MCKLRSLPAWDNKKVKPESAVVQRAKVETDDTEYLNVIADARLNFEKDLAPAIPCTTRGVSDRNLPDLLNSLARSVTMSCKA